MANPQNEQLLLSEMPSLAREAQARLVTLVHPSELQETGCQPGHRLPVPSAGRDLQTSRAWRLVRDFKDKPTAFPESCLVMKLTGLDKKPGSLGLQSHRAAPGRLCVFTARVRPQKWNQQAGRFQAAQEDLPS